MTLLVTGATGFIGSHLSRELIRRGYSVFGLSRSGKTENIASITGQKTFHLDTGDIQDAAAVQSIIKENHIKTIIHLAAQLPEKANDTSPFSYYDINARGTLNVLNAAHINNVERFIYASTMSVYSGPPEQLPVTESHPTRPRSPYGISKLTGELLCNAYAEKMKVAVLRYSGAYGRGERESDAVYRFVQQARSNKPLTVNGDGKQTSDYVYIGDVIQGTLAVLEKNVTGVYNIGSGEETSVKALAEQILKITGSKSKITFTAEDTDRPFRFYLDISKAGKDLNYTARNLQEGLRNYLQELESEE